MSHKQFFFLDRKFELEILIIGEKSIKHMFMCFKLADNIWIRYDNGSPFQYFDFERLYTTNNICICAAIYVNTTQAEEYKHSMSCFFLLMTHKSCVVMLSIHTEDFKKIKKYIYFFVDRLWVGTRPFCLSRHQRFLSNNMDQEVMQGLETLLENLSISND